MNPLYIGRFAPTPSGPLHFGSLVAALASYLEARKHGGQWLLRLEDVDAPRCTQAFADGIVRSLERLGFAWDGAVMRQSARVSRYCELLEDLKSRRLAYPCACTRRELADSALGALTADGATRYPGTCRKGLPPGKTARAWRVLTDAREIALNDALQGRLVWNLERDCGDFILLRADGCFAYQLAVAADDADQGVTHIVRGADLLDSTPRQVYLQTLLNFPTPAYAHLPVAVNLAGEKLSKQTRARAVDELPPAVALSEALRFLNHAPPEHLDLSELWRWARQNWNLRRLPRARQQVIDCD